jgi:hypothetical protein
MRHRHDRFAEKLLHRTLESEGTFTAEMEVSPDAQRFDGYFVPSRAHAARRRDLLDRLTTRACAFEAFRAAPGPAEIEGCIRKILNARHVLALARKPKPLPSLWILCAGDPRTGLAYTGATAMRGFTQGVYEAPAVLHTGLVVLRQLPEKPSTLILRLMGAGQTLRRALVELERLPEGTRERHVALPALLEYRAVVLEQPARTPEDEEFLMDTQDIVQRLKDEGRIEGQREGRIKGQREGRIEGQREGETKARQNDLVAIYRSRFGSVPRKVRAAIERTRDEAVLARWVEIFASRSTAEIVAAVAEKKA